VTVLGAKTRNKKLTNKHHFQVIVKIKLLKTELMTEMALNAAAALNKIEKKGLIGEKAEFDY
jgi:hypothetical protein